MTEDEGQMARFLAALTNELQHGDDIAGMTVAVLWKSGGTLRQTIMDEGRGNPLTLVGAAVAEALQLSALAILSATHPTAGAPAESKQKGPAAVLSLIRGGKPEPPAEG